MVQITVFDSEDDLERLTGLNHNELWEAGFNLDDWDFGFCSDIPVHVKSCEGIEDEGEERFYPNTELPTWRILYQMKLHSYFVEHNEYKGKHYYIKYHS